MLGIALEGGGARCAAQAGALAALAEHGHEPDALAGCGGGAWVAGLYALGVRGGELKRLVLDMMKAAPWALQIRKSGFSIGASGGMKSGVLCCGDNSRLLRTLRWQTMDASLLDVVTPLAIPAYDIEAADELMLCSRHPGKPSSLLWNRNASLAQAIAAGACAPGIMPPLNWRGRWLVGGAARYMTLPDSLTDLGATRVLKIRVLTTKEAGQDAITLAQAPYLPRDFDDDDTLRVRLPSTFTSLNFECMDVAYEMGYKSAVAQLPRLSGLAVKYANNVLQFPMKNRD
ncbi:MAG: patatin-like phospholipase family protein [Oscillospiraceae bacterium]|jgi:NTE family protein|nr:patatin-like phospholipase family protein [Oscillospiraceae bacterium]